MGVQELLVDTRAAHRLYQLEAEPIHRGLRADHPVLDRLAVHLRVMQQRWLVVENAPRSPAQGLRVGLQRGIHVTDYHGDLGDLHRGWRRDDLGCVTGGHVLPPQLVTGFGWLAAERSWSSRRRKLREGRCRRR